MFNTFGSLFRLTSFGESHGPGIGGVIDGCPAGIEVDEGFIQAELDKRKPNNAFAGAAGTTRNEADKIKILSGVYEGRTTGTPFAFFIENTNQKSQDYSKLADSYRPGHADRGYDMKYGFRDPRGGGRSSGRETIARVVGGSLAQLYLKKIGIEIFAYTEAIDGIYAKDFGEISLSSCGERQFFAPNAEVVNHWQKRIEEVRKDLDTLGGVVCIEAHGVPAGLGEPVFQKLDACLSYALMGVGAVKAVEIGDGTAVAASRGSKNNDGLQYDDEGNLCYASNHAGGIEGGISNGQPIIARAYVKPIPSVAKEQKTVSKQGENIVLSIGGRHDICAIPRIVPVLKAMAAITLMDMVLLQKRMENNGIS